jgi:cell division protein ZipA
MDFGIRELLMFVGALIFIGVLVDGVRRFQQNRRAQMRIKIDRKAQVEVEEDNLDWYAGELPSGGARVKSDEGEQIQEASEKITPTFSEPIDILMEGAPKVSAAPTASDVNEEFDEGFEEEVEESRQPVQAQTEPHSQAPSEVVNETVIEEAQLEAEIETEVELEAPIEAQVDNTASDTENQRDLFLAERAAASSDNSGSGISATKQTEQPAPTDKASVAGSASDQVPEDSVQPKKDLPEEILAINVIAKGESELDGSALLEAVLAFGLRFGEMDIFHRHENSNGQGPVIFSMASAINPGTFDIDAMPESTYKGVTFFMRLSEVSKRTFVLELMLDIAKRLANQLDAELKDDTRSVLSSQTVTHYKTRIQEYERRYLGQVLRN